MLTQLKTTIENTFEFMPNRNQLRDLERLIFEIMKREQTSLEEITAYLEARFSQKQYSGNDKFFALKRALIERRFPLTSSRQRIDTKKVFLNKPQEPLIDNWQVKSPFTPLKVFVEKEVKNSPLVKNFQKKFPKLEVEELQSSSDYLKKNKFNVAQLKKPLVFIVKEKWDFIKSCPCTKEHLGCGYWIFNLGFGCPFDCSYCFLQHYTNFPGIVLPANLDDFFKKSDAFLSKLKKPIRIGTGEFCDSLALDDITEYSLKLISYFKDKNVFFELKTKSAQISNLLTLAPPPNIVISWSLNPPSIIKNEELGTASLEERLEAAKKLQQKGYRVAFHFDPIICFGQWQKQYKALIDKLYSYLKPPFAWISLGTLRCNRQLKPIAEQRFPQSSIFYGELFLGEDKKLRYPKFLRFQIYKNVLEWIRVYDLETPVYLCMEDKETWQQIGDLASTKEIEEYLLKI
jgi:spore photoproduct lyase